MLFSHFSPSQFKYQLLYTDYIRKIMNEQSFGYVNVLPSRISLCKFNLMISL